MDVTAIDDDLDDGLWVIDVLDRIHMRMRAAGDHAGLHRLGRLDDQELILLAHAEIDDWNRTP